LNFFKNFKSIFRITVLKEICSGSFGKIYKGTVKPNDIAVALKIAHCEDAQAKRKDSLIHESKYRTESTFLILDTIDKQ